MVKLMVIVGVMLGVSACRDFDGPIELPDLDANEFRCNVEPILQARCAYPLCHGDSRRPFRIYARNRHRLQVPGPSAIPEGGPPLIDRNFPLTAEETQANFDVARGFARDTDQALLVLKPLDVSADGSFHRARDLFGGVDVFANRDDYGYGVFLAWVRDEAHPPDDCEVSTEVGP